MFIRCVGSTETDLCVEPELLRELKENFSVSCLWVAMVIVYPILDLWNPNYYHRQAVNCLNLPFW